MSHLLSAYLRSGNLVEILNDLKPVTIDQFLDECLPVSVYEDIGAGKPRLVSYRHMQTLPLASKYAFARGDGIMGVIKNHVADPSDINTAYYMTTDGKNDKHVKPSEVTRELLATQKHKHKIEFDRGDGSDHRLEMEYTIFKMPNSAKNPELRGKHHVNIDFAIHSRKADSSVPDYVRQPAAPDTHLVRTALKHVFAHHNGKGEQIGSVSMDRVTGLNQGHQFRVLKTRSAGTPGTSSRDVQTHF